MEKKSIEQWIYQGKKNCKNYLFFENKVLELTDFMSHHPGGIKAIKNYIYKDVTNILFEVYPHQRDITIARLLKYQVGLIPEDQAKKPKIKADKIINITPDKVKQKKRVCFNADHQDITASIRVNKSVRTEHKKHSQQLSRRKDSPTQSVNKSKTTKTSKSKSKKKQNLTSIRIINEQTGKTYDDYFKQNQQKVRQKQRAHTDTINDRKQKGLKGGGTCSFLTNQIDEQKPNFKVPIFLVKHMNKIY